MSVLGAWSGPNMAKEVQSSIKEYTIPTYRLMEMMVEQWVNADLLDMVWGRLDRGPRNVEEVLDESVIAEFEIPFAELKDNQEPAMKPINNTGYQVSNTIVKKSRKAGKKPDKKMLLELAARECRKVTEW